MNDNIHKPKHYCFSKFEPKDVIREWGLNFNLGSAVKYIARAGRKDDLIEDLEKAREFLTFEIEAQKAENLKKTPPQDHVTCKLGVESVVEKKPLQFHDGTMIRVCVPKDTPKHIIRKIMEDEISKVLEGKE